MIISIDKGKHLPIFTHERGQLAFQRGHWVQLLVAPQEAAGGPGAASPAGSALQVPTGARICLWQGWAAPLIGPTSSPLPTCPQLGHKSSRS